MPAFCLLGFSWKREHQYAICQVWSAKCSWPFFLYYVEIADTNCVGINYSKLPKYIRDSLFVGGNTI